MGKDKKLQLFNSSPESPSSGKKISKKTVPKEMFGKDAGRANPLLKNVSALVKQMQRLARQAHAEYSVEVDAAILNGSRDPRRIERLLDGILDFCFDHEMLQLYKKLCRHYFSINPVATAEYIYAYREMWDSETKEEQPTPVKKTFQKTVVKAKKPHGKKGGAG